jgi:hypothetical protein
MAGLAKIESVKHLHLERDSSMKFYDQPEIVVDSIK